MKLICFLSFAGFVVSATIPVTTVPATRSPRLAVETLSPNLLLARQATSCALVHAPAFTIDSTTIPATSTCTCNGGVEAAASRKVGSDGATTWECAANQTPMPVSTEIPAPTPTWVMQLEIGTTQFMVGDFKQDDFEPMMVGLCNIDGCADASASFKFNWTDTTSHFANGATGTVTMIGSVDDNISIVKSMVQAINTALLKTSRCEKVLSLFPAIQKHRRGDYLGPDTNSLQYYIPQCHLVSSISATLYSGPADTAEIRALMSFAGASHNPAALQCEEILGGINDALGLLPLPSFYDGAVTIASAFCGSS